MTNATGRNQFADRSLGERLWSRVDSSGGTYACWPWMGARFHFGHGAIKVNGRPWGAHRIAWELENGPVPEGQNVQHICDNPPCCNPRHLYVGTPRENGRDMAIRNRVRRGEQAPNARLTESIVLTARRRCAAGEEIREIARDFEVAESVLGRAVRGVTWAHLPNAVPGRHYRRKRRYTRRMS